MGLYLNPGNDDFRIAVNDDIYKDKSEMISFTNQRLHKNKRYLCECYHRDFDEVQKWYDGYSFSEGRSIYNPKSVVDEPAWDGVIQSISRSRALRQMYGWN